jgi:DNA-binding LytR/AlgR family response regulator
MKDLRILVVDDEVLIAEDLKDILNSFDIRSVYLAHSKSEAIKLLNDIKFDAALLDIRMEKELDGLELGELINSKFQIPFIYITAHSDMAMIQKIVKTKPAAYITKPFKKSDLFANINLINESIAEKEIKTLSIKDGYDTVIIPYNNIIYMESEGNYVNIYCINKKMVSRQSLDSIIESLDSKLFFKIHRSYIINTSFVKRYSKKEVNLNEAVLPVSRNVADEFDNFMKTRIR